MNKAASNLENRILILAPEGRNAGVAAAMLERAGLQPTICADSATLAQAIAEGAGAVLLTDHVVYENELEALQNAFWEQPAWSDLPVLLLAWPETGEEALAAVAEMGLNVRLVDRPASAPTLLTAAESALRARQRQYENRALLAELRRLNETLESRVVRRTEKVRELAAALAQAEEQERERVAQLLHDHLQQILVAITIQLELAREDAAEVPALETALAQINQMVQEAIGATRSLSVELSPPVLRSGDVAEALHWLAGEMKDTHQLQVVCTVEEGVSAAAEAFASLIFRATRELLFNVVKHAGSGRARVTLRREEEEIVLVVADQGQGFVPAQVIQQGTGYGLPQVRERVALYGGSVTVETAPEQGTTVTITLPL